MRVLLLILPMLLLQWFLFCRATIQWVAHNSIALNSIWLLEARDSILFLSHSLTHSLCVCVFLSETMTDQRRQLEWRLNTQTHSKTSARWQSLCYFRASSHTKTREQLNTNFERLPVILRPLSLCSLMPLLLLLLERINFDKRTREVRVSSSALPVPSDQLASNAFLVRDKHELCVSMWERVEIVSNRSDEPREREKFACYDEHRVGEQTATKRASKRTNERTS